MKRRSFLKLSGITAAASAAQASKIEGVAQTIFDQKRQLIADRFGAFYAHIDSAQITSVEAFEGDKFPNTMNNCVPDRTQNESRVLYPCVRKSYLKKGGPAANNKRGEEEFVRVSWDTALDLAAKALKDNFDKYGAEAIYGECYWWGGWGKVSWGRTVAHRMLTVLGGYVEESGDYSTGAGMVILPHIFGSNTVYEAPTTWKAILKNAKKVVFWGTDPLVTNQIAVGTPTHTNYKYFTELKKAVANGKIECFSVDVYRNNTARYVGSKLISPRACTDTAMMIGMCCYLYESGKFDEKFIKKYTVGFNKFKAYFLGESDGVKKDLAWAQNICGVSAEQLKALADALCEPSIIIAGRALQRQDHGEQAHWMITVLAAMLGHIGKEGLGFEFGLGYYSQGADKFIAPLLRGMSAIPSEDIGDENSPWRVGKNITIPSSRSIDALFEPGKVIDQNGKKIKLPHMRVAYNASGSFFTRHQDVNRAVAGMKKLDTIITAEPFWTAQAKLSDIVLPVALEPERYDIEASTNGEYIFLNSPAIEPMGEARSDFEICRAICKRWGREEAFSEGKSELEWMKEFYEDAKTSAKELGYEMPSFDEALKAGYVRFNKLDKSKEYYTRLADFRANPHKHALGTPSGKIEIFSPTIAKMNYDDCLGHPAWFEPFERTGMGGKIEANYPLAVVSPHSRFRLHSQLNNSLIRNYAEVNGREPMIIHPSTAAERGIKTGDIVRVYNERGEILVGTLVSDLVRKDTIIICEGAWYDPEVLGKRSLCQHGCVNVLTKDKGTSKLAQSNSAHTVLAQVEKYKGKIRPIQAFSKPVIAQQ